ncbi:DapH/DapD/GlmU-related protein [Sphingobacterium siyangense]|jgi:acetyltransferase-like isoleucine patch superfamily enzyme
MSLKQIVRKIYRSFKMIYFRKKYKLRNVHRTFYIGGRSEISSDLIAEAYSYIGPNCIIYPKVKIGEYTMIANDVAIIGGDHRYDKSGVPMIFSGRGELKPTEIGKDVWVGAYSKIMAGVKIGDGAIIALGSIVTKDVESFAIYAGVPAVKIKDRFKSKEEIESHKLMLSQPYSSERFKFDDLVD